MRTRQSYVVHRTLIRLLFVGMAGIWLLVLSLLALDVIALYFDAILEPDIDTL